MTLVHSRVALLWRFSLGLVAWRLGQKLLIQKRSRVSTWIGTRLGLDFNPNPGLAFNLSSDPGPWSNDI